ncbi:MULTISPECIES: heavy metal sensor histidine kinase [Delftia]|uniref:Sensor protein n=1 Tax=Delftia lacustris TaxID=558537 RepID=A0A1H3SIQ4_9BURK|nr:MULTISPECIES: heavy metal sensor histidine kinase [Delftia]EPD41087.1 two-component system, OmpR family, heavy metal sensor histidine kinase CusS [Delftia acidovorans CCUG 274B]PZP62949.1 MAG: HAMP domain-containing protein [Delftia acidovorans]SDZ37580.1 two-component system, OmpR family, heavy metal sensor histidine kinase CusS [Delftia lacustris]
MPKDRLLKKLTLTERLALFFTVVAAAVVLGLGFLFLVENERYFVNLDQMVLQDKKELIQEILSNSNSLDDTRSRLHEALNYHHDLYILVQDAQKNIVFQSTEDWPESISRGADLSSDAAGIFGVLRSHDAEFHTLHFAVATAYSDSSLRILIAADTKHHVQFMNGLRSSLVFYLATAIFLCGLLSWVAARQGLAPLREMRSRAAAVTSQQLTERMPVDAVPVEMADLAQELNRMLDRLQTDFQRLTDFSSDLAHELRTPISNLLTQTQVALSARRDAAMYRDILASNAEEFQRLARMVSDMLFLAKTERGVGLPRSEFFSARQEAQALQEFYEAVADEKRVRLTVQGDGSIEGDRLMFRRAVSNLLSNALRYTPESGEIAIKIVEVKRITSVSVENSGQDIDSKVLPRLFDRFYRADPSRAHPTSDGSGLGLAITRAIAEAHGGSVAVTSSHGRTCFTLKFPRRREKPQS